MNLLDYNNKYVKLIDDEGNIFQGMAYYTDADTAEEEEDTLTMKIDGEYGYLELLQSQIESVEILEE